MAALVEVEAEAEVEEDTAAVARRRGAALERHKAESIVCYGIMCVFGDTYHRVCVSFGKIFLDFSCANRAISED